MIQCNVRHLSSIGYGNDTYNYLLRVLNNNFKSNPLGLPAIHSADIPFTFWSGGTVGDGINALKATNFQKYLMGFVIDGNPNSLSPTMQISKYGEGAQVVNINGVKPMAMQKDIFADSRCDVDWRKLWENYGNSEEVERGLSEGKNERFKNEQQSMEIGTELKK